MPKMIRDATDKLIRALEVKMGYEPTTRQLQESQYLEERELPSLLEILKMLHESATTADLPGILGVSMNKVIAQAYAEAEMGNWQSLVTVKEHQNFKEQERIVFGEFGGVPIRPENAPYEDLHFPPEFITKYTPSTRGGQVIITEEMIRNDDTGALRRIGTGLATAAKETFKRFVGSLLTGSAGGGAVNTDQTHDGVTLYHASHGNTSTVALNLTNLLAARSRLKQQWVPGQETIMDDDDGISDSVTTIGVASTKGFTNGAIIRIGSELIKVGTVDHALSRLTGCTRGMYGTTAAAHADEAKIQIQARPLAFKKLYLVVPDALETTAYQLLASEQVPGGSANDANMMNRDLKAGAIEVVSMHPTYLSDSSLFWYLTADPESVPSLEVSILDGRKEPELIVADAPHVSNMLNFDRITYKVRHNYGGCQADWRGLQGNFPVA